MTHFIMDKANHLINQSDICMTEYDDKKHCFKVTLKDDSQHEVEKLPYNLGGRQWAKLKDVIDAGDCFQKKNL